MVITISLTYKRFFIFVFCVSLALSSWYWYIHTTRTKFNIKSKNLNLNPSSNFPYEIPDVTTQSMNGIRLKEKLKHALEKADKEYNILIWEPPFHNAVPRTVDRQACGACKVIYNKNKVSDPSTKAVVFHYYEMDLSKVPEKRRSDQLYIWWTMESANVLHDLQKLSLKEYDGFFNLTMSHRRDSDVYSPYGAAAVVLQHFKKITSGNPNKYIDDLVSKKNKLALWVVSNCGQTIGAKKRMNYTDYLISAGLKLDRKGRCFPNNGIAKNIEIAKAYKFYLAFENNMHCTDYVTEKLFRNAFQMEAVPVVMGSKREDYVALSPPGSFIFAEDFSSPSALARHLNYLDQNDTAYKEYFKWRTLELEDVPQYDRKSDFCQICRILHGINVDNIYHEEYKELYSDIPLFGYPNHSRIVPSIRDWYYGTESKDCLPNY